MRCPTIAAVLAAFLLSAPMAFGQGGVQQSGVVAPGHLAIWGRNGVIMDGGQPPVVLSGPILYATNPSYAGGVRPDGITSNDAAMKAATDACAAQGAWLMLPPGLIKFTGTATITLRNCALVGAGVPAGGTTTASLGTTILLTSTTTKPFLVQENWSISGMNFYWPGQTTGTTVYPALFSDDGTVYPFHWFLDHVNIVNAYDVFVQTAPIPNWGDGTITDSSIYAVHRMAKWSSIGDSINFNSVRFTNGAWQGICQSPAPCASTLAAAAAAAGANNAIFEVMNGSGGVVNVQTDPNTYAVFWRTALLIDSGGFWGESSMLMNYDTIGTIIDASSNGHYAIQNKFSTGSATCGACFDMGNNSGLIIDNAHIFAGKTLVTMSNGTVTLRNSQIDAVGNDADGAEYYLVHATGGTPIITLQNNSLAGLVSNTHVHGVRVDAGAVASLTMQNNPNILYFNDVIDIETVLNGPTIITGNASQGTAGTASVIIKGTNGVVFNNNFFDIPPHPTASACGTSPAVQGLASGQVFVGSGGSPVTSCTLTWPFPFTGGVGGGCIFSNETTSINSSVSGIPPIWVNVFGADMRGLPFWFNCPGVQ